MLGREPKKHVDEIPQPATDLMFAAICNYLPALFIAIAVRSNFPVCFLCFSTRMPS